MNNIKKEEGTLQQPEVEKKPVPKPTIANHKKGNLKPDKAQSSNTREYVIPEKRAARIKDLNAEANAFNASYQARMHENLVTICEDLDISKDDMAEYNSDFTKIIVRKSKPATPKPEQQ